jgi:hypothetical protein
MRKLLHKIFCILENYATTEESVMAFYLRKSIRFGPLRLNLSKSGLGVSAGVKGLRIGTGPRGNYIHAGRGGIYYRKTLPSKKTKEQAGPQGVRRTPALQPETAEEVSELIGYRELESDSVVRMVDGDASELLDELNNRQQRKRVWPFVGTASVATLLWGFGITNVPLLLVGLVGTILATPVAALWDRRRKTTVLLYNLEPELEEAYRRVYEQYEALKGCKRLWHIEGMGNFRDSKYHAGATHGIKRRSITPFDKAPKFIRTNVPVPTLPAGKQLLCFFPDRLLVFETNRVGAVPYHDLSIDIQSSRFIEDERVPSDAKVIDWTWQYVNKRGGPDKRFKDNKELPVVLYEELILTSDSGLEEHYQISKSGIADTFKNSVLGLTSS